MADNTATRSGVEIIMGTIQICKWSDSDYHWNSDCGFEFIFNTDGPIENGFLFCPKCGRNVEVNYLTEPD